MKKVVVAVLLAAVAFTACDKAEKETKQDLVSNTLEKAIKENTGTDVDLPDAKDITKSASFVSYKFEDKVYLKGDEKIQATVTFSKYQNQDGLSITFQLTTEKGNVMIVGMSNIPKNFSLPLKGKFTKNNAIDKDNPTASFMPFSLPEKGMEAIIKPYEGELIITELSKNNMEFEINAKGGDITDADSPSNWKTITVSGKIANPFLMSVGIDKNSVLK